QSLPLVLCRSLRPRLQMYEAMWLTQWVSLVPNSAPTRNGAPWAPFRVRAEFGTRLTHSVVIFKHQWHLSHSGWIYGGDGVTYFEYAKYEFVIVIIMVTKQRNYWYVPAVGNLPARAFLK